LIWALVVVATGSVVALAMLQGNRESSLTGRPAPQIALPRLDGSGKAAIPRGKVTLIDFWATWCAPCRVSMPRVQQLWQDYRKSGVELYSIDTDDPGPDREPQVKEFLAQNRLSIPVVLDDGSAAHAFAVASLPTLLLLDKEGKVVFSQIGMLSAGRERDLRSALDRAVTR
jgi:thiol-disulfide isomerase/thioredoxin